MSGAAARWAELLTGRAIPREIIAAGPGDPYRHDPARFAPPAVAADTPSRRAALDLLDPGGTVLDVGCGGGAAGLALAGPGLRHLTGFDHAQEMLDAFGAACAARDVPHHAVLGRWPDAAADAGIADVVVCHHVGYNTAALGPFAVALGAAARRGVVVELHAVHPMAWLDPLWTRFHGLRRPPPATADDAVAVLREAGVDPVVRRWERPPRPHDEGEEAGFALGKLCLPAERLPEVVAALGTLPPRRRAAVTLTWSTG